MLLDNLITLRECYESFMEEHAESSEKYNENLGDNLTHALHIIGTICANEDEFSETMFKLYLSKFPEISVENWVNATTIIAGLGRIKIYCDCLYDFESAFCVGQVDEDVFRSVQNPSCKEERLFLSNLRGKLEVIKDIQEFEYPE